MPKKPKPERDLDERTAIPLDPEAAIKALLKVDPKAKPKLSEKDAEKIVHEALTDKD